MSNQDRRRFLTGIAKTAGAAAAFSAFPPAIQRALAIQANNRTGTIQDVEHIVIFMQENRSFDHYFGALNGVRGFGDPFPIPTPSANGLVNKTVWSQPNATAGASPAVIAPFHLNTEQTFNVMRVSGTPHSWGDAQGAWDNGLMSYWTQYKQNHSMGYFSQADLPFQYALANAFTICDAYHCSSQTGTNTNRLFQWTGTNDGLALGNGPATYNDYDWFDANPGNDGGYTWTTYPERLEAAGISWQVYENMDDNFTDNPLAGFHSFRAAWYQTPGYSEALRARGVSTRDLDKFKEDVLNGTLPAVSFIVATAEGSEHPGPSSPAQGADYTAKVLDALTSNPEVWSKTVLFLNFDENDGFFDHVPPPAPPSYEVWSADPAQAQLAGASTVDTLGEYHEHLKSYHTSWYESYLLHRPYGLGPRVPMYVISPWSKGGWVNSQVFDHTSVLRFVEKRFGVEESNISPWRRAVCGDLTSAFNFADPDDTAFFAALPGTLELADKARALPGKTTPLPPSSAVMPVQAQGVRPSRALPYELHATSQIKPNTAKVGATQVELTFANTGEVAAVFHVYDRLNLTHIPRRYTVEPGKELTGVWAPATSGSYDLWVLGPNGFHRHFTGNAKRVAAAAQPNPDVLISYDTTQESLLIKLVNKGTAPCTFTLEASRYFDATPTTYTVAARGEIEISRSLTPSARWYDFTVKVKNQADYKRRFAGRLETGAPSISDPAMYGPAIENR